MKTNEFLSDQKLQKELEQEEISLNRLSQPKKKRRKGKKKETFDDFINRLIDEDISYG